MILRVGLIFHHPPQRQHHYQLQKRLPAVQLLKMAKQPTTIPMVVITDRQAYPITLPRHARLPRVLMGHLPHKRSIIVIRVLRLDILPRRLTQTGHKERQMLIALGERLVRQRLKMAKQPTTIPMVVITDRPVPQAIRMGRKQQHIPILLGGSLVRQRPKMGKQPTTMPMVDITGILPLRLTQTALKLPQTSIRWAE